MINSKQNQSQDVMKHRGFTIVELLCVIAIIGLLASMILAGLNVARERARVLRARRDIAQLVTAWTAYYSDYHSFPTITEESMEDGWIVTRRDVVQILRGLENYNNQNPRRIPYMEFHQLSTQFLDPWGQPYRIIWDDDNTGQVMVPEGPLRMSIAIWSAGRDGQDGTRHDVTSWRQLL